MQRPKILIVDDEIIIARELEQRLQGMGYEVAGIASSGSEAIGLAAETQPNLVLMDIVLRGDMDGIEAAAAIRRTSRVPVIFVTAYTDRATLERAQVTEPFAYIVKPFSERELHANIAIALYKHQADARMRKLERWFAAASEEMADAVVASDAGGSVVLFNPAAEAITGWASADAVGRKAQDVFCLVEKSNGHVVPLGEAAAGPIVCLAGETLLVTKDGRRIPVENTTVCVRDESDRPMGTVSVFRDLTGERHQALIALNAEVALTAAQAPDLRTMLQHCTEALVRHLGAAFARIWTLDPSANTLVLQASAGMYTHLDGPHSRVPVGKFKIGLIAEERKPHLSNDVLNDPRVSDHEWAKREGMTAFAGHPLVVDGRLVGVMAMFSRHVLSDSVLNMLGSVANTVAVAIERKHTEAEVHRTRQRLEHVVTSSPSVLYTLAGTDAASFVLTWISPNVKEMMGYEMDEVMQPTWWHERVHKDDLERSFAELQNDLFSRGRLAQEYRFLHKNGEYRWVRSELRLLRDESSGTAEAVGSWSDITERKLLENQLRQAQKMEAVGQLAGGVAHDFNNLLTVISGYSDVILRKPGGDTGTMRLVGQISKAGERAASLTRQLLAFSRKQILEPRVLDLNLLVTEQEKMLRRLIGEDITMSTALDPKLEHVNADPGQLEQVIMNLAVNARDAMAKGGKLTLETCNTELDVTYAQTREDVRPGAYVLLAVSDTGCGMTPEIMAHIFEPFFTTKGTGKGTGLGLATAYGIVKQSGGHMAVYSEPGVGTTFKIFLPAAEERAKHQALAGVRPMPKGNETLLLVEDEDAVRAIAHHTLESCGYKVLQASNGAQALRICEQEQGRIQLMVTDVVMPEMPGRALVEQLGQRWPEIRVLFTSGYTDDAVIRHGVLQAETAFLQKPFTPLALATKVREILDQQRVSA